MNRKVTSLISLILALSICSITPSGMVFAQDEIAETVQTAKVEQNDLPPEDDKENIPLRLQKEIKESIIEIYGKNNSEEIFEHVMQIAEKSVKERAESLKQEDIKRTEDWYKDEIIYMFYIDQFGVKDSDSTNTFKDAERMFGYLKDLGVTTLYMLPFADSPMQDAGFDVKDPRDVRKELGGMEEFKQFISEAKKAGFKIKADLVLNHFSQEHDWFKAIENGDLSKLDYFVVREDMPVYKKYQDEKLGTVIEYKEPDGKISKRRYSQWQTTCSPPNPSPRAIPTKSATRYPTRYWTPYSEKTPWATSPASAPPRPASSTSWAKFPPAATWTSRKSRARSSATSAMTTPPAASTATPAPCSPPSTSSPATSPWASISPSSSRRARRATAWRTAPATRA